jgi:hypothetical protein
MVLRNMPSLYTLVLKDRTLGSTETELVPALCHNTSIKMLDMSGNGLSDIDSAKRLRDIIRRNKSMIALNLSGKNVGKRQALSSVLPRGWGATQRYWSSTF